MVMNPRELDAAAPDNLNPEVFSSVWLNTGVLRKRRIWLLILFVHSSDAAFLLILAVYYSRGEVSS